MVLSRTKLTVIIAAMITAAGGCATVPANSGQDSFAEYAESVFRHQNQLSSRLMMLSDAEQLPDSEVYDNLEEQMREACHLLNEYAERESSGESMGLRFKTKVQNSIEGCDRSIQRMEAFLKGIGQGN